MKGYLMILMMVTLIFMLVTMPVTVLAEGDGALLTIDLTPILQALLGLLASVITVKVIPWIKSKTTAQQQATLAMAIDFLVYGAEQIHGSGAGQQKIQYVKDELGKRGYTVDIAQIEAAVKRMNDKSVIEYGLS